MKNLLTLSAIAALSAASLGAQAQFTVDGTLAPAEVGTGVGKYQLLGTYTGTHSISNRGLKALYMGTTATTLNIMVVASPEQTSYSALVLYLDAPSQTGVAAGTRLAGGNNNTSQLKHRPTLDMPVDHGFRITVSPLNDANNAMYLSRVDYTAALVGNQAPDSGLGTGPKDGSVALFVGATDPFNNTRTAFKTSTTGSVATNTTTGWEFEIPLTALGGAATGAQFHVMAAYVADGGEFYSDVLPQVAGQTTDLGPDPNFSTIPRSQFYTYQVGSGPLANRTASPALQASAYPNPLTTASRLSYLVPTGTQPVNVDVYNPLGQKALTLLNTTQAAGAQALSLQPLQKLAAGTYLVTLRVGQELSTHRVVVE